MRALSRISMISHNRRSTTHLQTVGKLQEEGKKQYTSATPIKIGVPKHSKNHPHSQRHPQRFPWCFVWGKPWFSSCFLWFSFWFPRAIRHHFFSPWCFSLLWFSLTPIFDFWQSDRGPRFQGPSGPGSLGPVSRPRGSKGPPGPGPMHRGTLAVSPEAHNLDCLDQCCIVEESKNH